MPPSVLQARERGSAMRRGWFPRAALPGKVGFTKRCAQSVTVIPIGGSVDSSNASFGWYRAPDWRAAGNRRTISRISRPADPPVTMVCQNRHSTAPESAGLSFRPASGSGPGHSLNKPDRNLVSKQFQIRLIPTALKNDRRYESLFGAPPPANPTRDTNRRKRWKSQRLRRLVLGLAAK
jgi:hypothetical protein